MLSAIPKFSKALALLCLLGLAVILGAACSQPPPSSAVPIEVRFQEAVVAMRQKEVGVEEKIRWIEEAKPQSQKAVWKDRIRLLGAEYLLGENDRRPEVSELLAEPAGRPLEEARRGMLLGVLAVVRGDPSAKEAFQSAHRKAQNLGSADLLTEIEYHWSKIYAARQQFSRAEQVLLPAAARTELVSDPCLNALALSNLGAFARHQHVWTTARDRHKEALKFAERCEVTRYHHSILVNLASAENRLGFYADALKHLEEARGLDRPDTPNLLLELGNYYFYKGEYATAIDTFRKGLEFIARKAQKAPKDEEQWLEFLTNIVAAQSELHECAAAEKTQKILSETDKELIQGLSDTKKSEIDDRLRLASGRIALICGRTNSAPGIFQSVLATTKEERLQARAHAGLFQAARAQGDEEASDRTFEAFRKWFQEVSERGFDTTFAQPAIWDAVADPYRQYVNDLLVKRRVDRALEVADAATTSLLRRNVEMLKVERFVDTARKSGAYLVRYWVGRTQTHAWVISPRSDTDNPVQLHVVETGRRVLEQEVEKFLEDQGEQKELFVDRVEEDHLNLAKWLIQPLAIPAGSRVILVLDGPLHRLNFETLVLGSVESPRFWIEDVTVSCSPSFAHLVRPDTRLPQQIERAILAGNPLHVDDEYPASSSFEEELEGIGQTLGEDLPQILLSKGKATPAELLKTLSSAEGVFLLHVAAHAQANQHSPLESSIILSRNSEDGRYRLRAEDLRDLPLDNLELAILSSCETAGQNAYGIEGAISIVWAFFAGGARNVIASSQQVPESGTPELMKHFYSELLTGQPIHVALRNAKLQMLETWKDPHFWGELQHFLAHAP